MTDGNLMFRRLSSQHFKHDVPVLAINRYYPDSHGEDDFSRKQVWFYTYGDEEIKEEFESKFTKMFEERFVNDDLEWDMMALYPTHVKDEVNPNLRDLFMDVASKTGISFEQVLTRNQNVRESHELEDEKAKVINLEGSIDVNRDIEGKNIILVDNIALSGISLLHGANRLKQKGAENVFAVTIGTNGEVVMPEKDVTASQLLRLGKKAKSVKR